MNDDTKPTLENLMAAIALWGREQFPRSTDYSRLTHLREEVRELFINPSDGEEMADIFFLLINHADANKVDLRAEVQRKWEINLARTWGKPDASGVVRHEGSSKRDERVCYEWFRADILLPGPGIPVIVAIPRTPFAPARWARACWIPKEYQVHGPGSGEYEGDLDYSDEKDEFYWPEGWYEWNETEEVHWMIDDAVSHWMHIEMPEPS